MFVHYSKSVLVKPHDMHVYNILFGLTSTNWLLTVLALAKAQSLAQYHCEWIPQVWDLLETIPQTIHSLGKCCSFTLIVATLISAIKFVEQNQL